MVGHPFLSEDESWGIIDASCFLLQAYQVKLYRLTNDHIYLRVAEWHWWSPSKEQFLWLDLDVSGELFRRTALCNIV
jgi:hypothetical protein